MFVSQTIFLADIVDYGEYKNGERNESITFSMKGFLQKMAYTIQTIFLFGGLAIVNYSDQVNNGRVFNDTTKSAIGLICFGIPAILIAVSFVVFTKNSNSTASLPTRFTTTSWEKETAKKNNNRRIQKPPD